MGLTLLGTLPYVSQANVLSVNEIIWKQELDGMPGFRVGCQRQLAEFRVERITITLPHVDVGGTLAWHISCLLPAAFRFVVVVVRAKAIGQRFL